MKTGVLIVLSCMLLSSCRQDISYISEIERADSYALYLFDTNGENPLLVDSGHVKMDVFNLTHDKPGSDNCTPHAMLNIYTKNGPSSKMMVYLNGSCFSLKLITDQGSKTFKLNENKIDMITKHRYPVMQNFSWLEGTWRTKDTLPFIEQWTWVDGQKLEGKGLKITDTPEPAVKPLEKLELVYADGKINYMAYVNDQNEGEPVAFQLDENSLGNDTFAFLNPNHDFPQRIAYKIIDSDTLEVTVGEMDSHGKSFTLTLIRTLESPEDMIPDAPGI